MIMMSPTLPGYRSIFTSSYFIPSPQPKIPSPPDFGGEGYKVLSEAEGG